MDKANPKLVSQRLGHSTVAVTLSIYGHVLPGSDEEAAENYEAAYLAG